MYELIFGSVLHGFCVTSSRRKQRSSLLFLLRKVWRQRLIKREASFREVPRRGLVIEVNIFFCIENKNTDPETLSLTYARFILCLISRAHCTNPICISHRSLYKVNTSLNFQLINMSKWKYAYCVAWNIIWKIPPK